MVIVLLLCVVIKVLTKVKRITDNKYALLCSFKPHFTFNMLSLLKFYSIKLLEKLPKFS